MERIRAERRRARVDAVHRGVSFLRGAGPISVLVVSALVLVGGFLPGLGETQATAGTSDAASALQAVDAFMDTWNSRLPRIWAGSLHFPHTRQWATGGRVWEDLEDYVRGVDYERVIATGWHHSAWDSKRVIHAGSDKAHVAGQYTRYTADIEKLLANQVTYIVSKAQGRWGIQARFAAGSPTLPAEERMRSEAAAKKRVREYLAAFNARDPEAWAATLNYPHVRIAGGTIRVWETRAEYAAYMDFDRFIRQTGWDHSEWDSMEAVQVAQDGVNVALVFSRYDAEDRRIATYNTLYLVTRQDGHWGVRARSSFAP